MCSTPSGWRRLIFALLAGRGARLSRAYSGKTFRGWRLSHWLAPWFCWAWVEQAFHLRTMQGVAPCWRCLLPLCGSRHFRPCPWRAFGFRTGPFALSASGCLPLGSRLGSTCCFYWLCLFGVATVRSRIALGVMHSRLSGWCWPICWATCPTWPFCPCAV